MGLHDQIKKNMVDWQFKMKERFDLGDHELEPSLFQVFKHKKLPPYHQLRKKILVQQLDQKPTVINPDECKDEFG